MEVLKRLLKMLIPYRFVVMGSFMSALLVMVLNIAVPQLIRIVIDRVIMLEELHLLQFVTSGIIAIALFKALFTFLQRYSIDYASQRIIYDLRNNLYSHLQYLSFSYYNRMPTGQLMSRATSDVETLRRFLDFGIIHFLQGIITIIGVLSIMFYMNAFLAAVSLAILPFLTITIYQFGKKVKPAYTDIQKQLASLTSVLQENLSGIRLVQAFTQENRERDKFFSKNKDLFDRNIFAVRLWSFYFPYMNFISGLGTALIFWLGGRAVILGQLQLGELVAFNSYLLLLVMPLRMLGWVISLIQRSISSGERIFEILDSEPEVKDYPGALDLGKVEGHVEFRNVNFSYDGEKEVLKNISFTAEPGDFVAIVGSTGSGKSTLVEMISRFYDPDEGKILLDGYDLRDITLNSLRSNIGMVFQDTFLFSASLAENIAYGTPGASREEIMEAAKGAQIHDFIESLPEGYDTEIGERGLGLSGGQKQRIAIARALLFNPAILILDDFTANVDYKTEFLIRRALKNLIRGKTVFLIAQRLSSLKNADRILVMEDGRIVEKGTHKELLLARGLYAEIYKMQCGEEPTAS
ncbi:MAG: ABC transporter ATP-binding protein [Candidatus Syntrophonatronum acetioxidans]|uniref:ABC transporter ATP-binding protein n=1 Tax=Candidatus Syntrophonatronum acetioxidans TaxID=1795816 RepID=A0A424YHK1_9FIRM|nr:MAG: ABC transporter ATP-binding protein [Candidatus Syntrophonatronum acetioxidans]